MNRSKFLHEIPGVMCRTNATRINAAKTRRIREVLEAAGSSAPSSSSRVLYLEATIDVGVASRARRGKLFGPKRANGRATAPRNLPVPFATLPDAFEALFIILIPVLYHTVLASSAALQQDVSARLEAACLRSRPSPQASFSAKFHPHALERASLPGPVGKLVDWFARPPACSFVRSLARPRRRTAFVLRRARRSSVRPLGAVASGGQPSLQRRASKRAHTQMTFVCNEIHLCASVGLRSEKISRHERNKQSGMKLWTQNSHLRKRHKYSPLVY